MGMNLAQATKSLPAQQKLSVARMMIAHKNPYFTSLVIRMIFREVDKESQPMGIGVSRRGVVYWRRDFIDHLTAEQLAVLLLNKSLHVLFRHSDRARAGAFNPEVFNEAADCEINDDLEAAGWTMESVDENGQPCRLLTPSHFKLESHKSAEWYYNEIMQQRAQNQAPPVNHGTARGCGGSGAGGAPGPNEPSGQPQPNGEGDASGSEQGDGGMDGRSEGELEGMRDQVAQGMKKRQAGKGQGSMPLGWQVWSDEELKPPTIRWQDELRQTVRNAFRAVAGNVDRTFKKSNRKQAGLGFGSGRPVLAGWHKPTPNVMIAIDTSGSMGGLMPEIMAEVQSILTEVRGSVSFVSIDAEVQSSGRTADWRVIARESKGGGGTDFRPLFDHIEKMPKNEQPNVVIFATDGCGPAPKDEPDPHVIWLLCGDYTMKPASWGKYISTDKKTTPEAYSE
jgi:predicted metal-dependent peptidase